MDSTEDVEFSALKDPDMNDNLTFISVDFDIELREEYLAQVEESHIHVATAKEDT